MTSKTKSLGLALIAVFAIGAVTAQGAWGAEEFHASASPTVITGEQDGSDVFSVAGGAASITCTAGKGIGTVGVSDSPTVTGTATAGSTSTPSGCVDNVSGAEAIVHTNHCAGIAHAATDANGHAEGDIECETGSHIEITIPGLGVTLSIGAQNGLKGVHYTPIETGGKKELTVHSTVTNIAATCSGFACVFIGGEHLAASYTGTEIIRGYADTGSPVTGTAKTTPGSTTEGEQISITKE